MTGFSSFTKSKPKSKSSKSVLSLSSEVAVRDTLQEKLVIESFPSAISLLPVCKSPPGAPDRAAPLPIVILIYEDFYLTFHHSPS